MALLTCGLRRMAGKATYFVPGWIETITASGRFRANLNRCCPGIWYRAAFDARQDIHPPRRLSPIEPTRPESKAKAAGRVSNIYLSRNRAKAVGLCSSSLRHEQQRVKVPNNYGQELNPQLTDPRLGAVVSERFRTERSAIKIQKPVCREVRL